MASRTAVSSVANKALTDAAAALLSTAEIRNGGGASVTLPKVCTALFPPFVGSFLSSFTDLVTPQLNAATTPRVYPESLRDTLL